MLVAIDLVPVELHHIKVVAEEMRECDRLEVFRAGGICAFEALVRSVVESDVSKTVILNDRPVGVYGVVEHACSGIATMASPWCLGTDAGYSDLSNMLEMMTEVSNGWKHDYDVLWNKVDAQNEPAIEFLKRLDFTIFPPENTGFFGDPFCLFQWRKGLN